MTMDLFTFLEDTNTLKVDPKPWMQGGDYILARATNDTLTGIIDDCIAGGLYALDLETTGLNSCVYDGETTSKIVGCCLSPDGKRGYYIPLRHKTGQEHNVSWSQWKREMQRLIDSPARAIFHNGKFDQEFLQNCGGEPLGEWDEPKKWEDTLILAYLRDTRSKSKGLKHLSKTELGMEMIELDELFPEDRRKGDLDFSDLDPSWEPVTWYGASDAICTWNLYQKLHPQVIPPSMGQRGQGIIYAIEKLCVASTRWMERARIMTDQVKARELIRIGQREWLASLEEVYESSSAIVGRDVRPGYYRIMQGAVQGLEGFRFDTEEVSPSYMDRVETARAVATKGKLDPLNEKKKVKTVTKRVASLNKEAKGVTEDVEFPVVYDVLSAQQLGSLLRECKVPGLTATEKSGQVATSADELEKVLESVGDKFPFAGKIKRFREVSKALSTYLLPLIEDSHPDGSIRAYFNAFSIDTGRFNAPSSKNPKMDGGTRFPFHGTPATYDPNRPECMGRIRECIIARPGKVIAACDFSGVELRIVTNISGEPKWLREFFHCSGCDRMFPMGTAEDPVPMAPPPYCPDCGSDKIGDLHTLTALSIYGEDAPKRENWKQLRSFGKSCNFALCYGGSGNAVVTATGCDKNEGYRIKDQFDKTYKVLSGWWKTQAIAAKKYKFVTTAFGRRYPLPDIDHEMGGFRAKAERNAVNGPIQGCLHFDSKIPTSLGLLTVKELWDRQAGGEYDRFKVWTGKAWVDGRALFSGVKELRVTTFDQGRVIQTSPEHLFRTWCGTDHKWVPQHDLAVGTWVSTSVAALDWGTPEYHYDSVATPQQGHQFHKGMTAHNSKSFSFHGNSSLLWEFLGMVYGDGSITQNSLSVVVGGNRDYPSFSAEAHAKEWVARLNKELGVGAIVQRHADQGRTTLGGEPLLPKWSIGIYNKAFRSFCRDILGLLDQTTHTKRFPRALWSESLENRAAFLRGYFSTDGTAGGFNKTSTRVRNGKTYQRHANVTFSVRSANHGLLQDTQALLTSLGIRSSYTPRSLRVEVQDRHTFRDLVGFNIGYKTERAASLKVGPYFFQRQKLPPTLIQLVGNTVRQSKTYHTLTSPEQAAVLRLVAGSGSKAQCQLYLNRLPAEEVPVGLSNALVYDYAQVKGMVAPGQFVTMYDIEVFDDDHAFVCDGMVVHNTSADITKIAMGLVYRECKQRGWLDKVHMLITMHDELVFEIDKDILEEAVDIFVRLMCRNELVQKLNWPVPLTSDVEMGPNWMVEWDLKKIRKKGECPPELEGCFKGIGPKAKAEALKGNAQPVEKKPELPIFTYKVKGFTLGEIEPLARILAAGASNPVAKLVVVGPNGEDLTGSLSVVWSGKIPMVGEA